MIPDKDKLFYIIAILLLFVVVDACYNWYKDKENKDASRLLLNILAILGTISAGIWLFDNTLSTRNAFKNSSLGAVGAAAFLLPALIRLSTVINNDTERGLQFNMAVVSLIALLVAMLLPIYGIKTNIF
jgi:hypothetical protein